MRLSGILASLIGLGEAQDIITDQPADEGIIFNQSGETHQISYLDREINEDDVNVQCTSQSMCIKMSKQFLIDEDITTKFEGVHLKNCTQEWSHKISSFSPNLSQKNPIFFYLF
jgi:hypothetical protein